MNNSLDQILITCGIPCAITPTCENTLLESEEIHGAQQSAWDGAWSGAQELVGSTCS